MFSQRKRAWRFEKDVRRPQESIFVRDRRFFAAAFSEIDLDNIDTREE